MLTKFYNGRCKQWGAMMLEMIMGRSRGGIVPGTPVMGFNFDQGKSTSTPAVTSYSGGVITAHGSGSEISGYTQSLRCLGTFANVTPLSAIDTLGSSDFTLECWCWMSTIPGDYYPLLLLTFKNGKYLTIRVANGGYGQRMQVGIDLGNGGNFSPDVTGTSLRNGWHHYALVRKDNRCVFYIDGVQQMLASGTGVTYNLPDFNGAFDLSGGLSAFTIGKANSGTGDLYMPEFGLYNFARYSANFTPPHPIFK